MPTESPFREEDLSARVDALRVERDRLVLDLETAVRAGRRRAVWSWGRFLLGLAVLPSIALVGAFVLAWLA
jgi:hypothetical protein